ncbi:MAG: prephenate dehydrogenase/arogenate dehydrogenase family protein [Clostridia bacterium]
MLDTVKNQKICILGMGLIGGSLAKAIHRSFPDWKIVGVDTNEQDLLRAKTDGVISDGTTSAALGVENADIVFICTPLSDIVRTVKKIIPVLKPGSILTDVGSTKSEILVQISSILPQHVTYIGGHPMAGSEKSGYLNSTAHLFENAYYILTPFADTSDTAVQILSYILENIGSIPITLSPLDHDKITGLISHLPHIIASGLVNLARSEEDQNSYVRKLAAGGFKDITRIASSNPHMWTDICMANRGELKSLIDSFINILDSFRNLLDTKDKDRMLHYFEKAKIYRDNIPNRPHPSIISYFDIDIDVEDKPGIIGEVTSVLGKHSLNIKNIAILNNREEDHGVLRLSFPDAKSQTLSYEILSSLGYIVHVR